MHTLCMNVVYGKASLAQKAIAFSPKLPGSVSVARLQSGRFRIAHTQRSLSRKEAFGSQGEGCRLGGKVRETREKGASNQGVLRYGSFPVPRAAKQSPMLLRRSLSQEGVWGPSIESLACDRLLLTPHASKEVRRIAVPSCRSLSGLDPKRLR